VTAFYTNAMPPTVPRPLLTINTTGQSLTVSGTTCSSVIPNGATTLTTGIGGAVTYTVSPPVMIT
jgi:hypothetical protein